MRTNIVLDEALVKQAMRLSGLTTKKAVVEESLRLFVQMQKQKKLVADFVRDKTARSKPPADPLLTLAGTLSHADAETMLQAVHEGRQEDWDSGA